MEHKSIGSTTPLEQTFYVNGCKVTTHYSQAKNPKAVQEIRNILLSGIKTKKS